MTSAHNGAMSALDAQINELYQGPLDSFTASRNALAKTLTGDAKKRVASLAKPMATPWIVNQTYWHARGIYDELMSAGKQLRTAHVGALQGRATDVRRAADRHAAALAAAVAEGTTLAGAAGVQPQTDALRRMFEAISTRTALPEEHGRFVKPLEPAGFEALSGLSIVASPRKIQDAPQATTKKAGAKRGVAAADLKAAEEQERRRERDRVEAERKRKAAIEKAEAEVAAAVQDEQRARFEWERARKKVEALERALDELRSNES